LERDLPSRSVGYVIAITMACLVVSSVLADSKDHDWPQFRGPNRDGISHETGLSKRWPEDGPPEVWRVKLGGGYSGLSVHDDRIYTMYGRGSDEFAAAIDVLTGETIWKFRTDSNRRDSQGDGPRSTPTVSGGIVYVLGARGNLHALKADDGESVWSHDLQKEYGANPPQWGASMSPLIEGDLLLVDAGGAKNSSILAFDRKTGKEVWHAFDDKPGYSTPIAITVGGVRQVLFFTARNLLAVGPSDGTILWRIPWKTSYDVNAAAPVFIAPDRFFVSSGYDVGGAVYEIAVHERKVAVKQVWKNREMKNQFSSSILLDGHLYGFDDKTLKCIDAATGERLWSERGFGHGSLTYVDGHLIVLGDQGTLALVEALPDAYREKSRTQVFETKTWTVPTFVGGRLYLRDQNELVSFDVAE